MTVEEFNLHVRIACSRFTASITSGHRTLARNVQVGGAPNSQHLGFKAADLVMDDWNQKKECITFLTNCGLRVIDEVQTKNHLHIDDKNNS